MKDEQKAVLVIADQQDEAIEDGLAEAIPLPARPYKSQVVDNLHRALSGVTELMGVEFDPMPAGGPVEKLDGETVRLLAMAAKAAADYGQPMPLEPGEIRGDNELVVLSDFLLSLARDRDFRDFLNQEVEEEVLELKEEKAPRNRRDADALFMSRM